MARKEDLEEEAPDRLGHKDPPRSFTNTVVEERAGTREAAQVQTEVDAELEGLEVGTS